jgi:hypothetical protein
MVERFAAAVFAGSGRSSMEGIGEHGDLAVEVALGRRSGKFECG